MRKLLLGLCLGLAGCAPAASGGPGAAPAPVAVSLPVVRDVRDDADFSGRGPVKPALAHGADAEPAGTTRNGTVAATPSYSHALPDGQEPDTRAKP